MRTLSWDVAHAFDTSIEGWIVLVARRHITALADLSEAEAATLGPLIAAVSRALRDTVGCEKTYVVQFAEHPRHRHVHVHVIARPIDLPPEERGPGIFSRLEASPAHRVSEDRMNQIAHDLRRHLHEAGMAPVG